MKFTIGTVTSNIEFEEDLRLIKSSLLYADEIELIGMAEYAVFKYLPMCVSSAKDLYTLMDNMIPILKLVDGNGAPEMLDQIEILKEQMDPFMPLLRKKKHRSTQEILAQKKAMVALEQSKDMLTEGIKKIIDTPSSQAINDLIEKGIVSVFDYKDIEFNVDSLAGGYFGNLVGTVKNRDAFPLFDKASNEVISHVAHSKILNFAEINPEILRHAGVSTNILMTLPSLGEADFDEIVDFKKENERALIGFRKAIYDFSEKIKSLPWDDDFEFECTKLYATEVAPKIEEINELSTQTSVAKNMGRKFVRDAEVRKSLKYVSGGLAAQVTTKMDIMNAFTDIKDLLLSAAMIVIAPKSVEAFMKMLELHSRAKEEIDDINRDIRGNTMFYYYKARNKFS